MTTLARTATLGLLAVATVHMAQAATYVLVGTFGTTVYSGPLNGGSFSGTFDFTRPAAGSFDILLLDASHVLRAELTNANAHATFYANVGSTGYDEIQFVSNDAPASQTILSLDFALGFTGVGSVAPFPTAFPHASFATLGGQTAATTSTVTGGFSAAVPEPATMLMMALGMPALLARSRRAA